MISSFEGLIVRNDDSLRVALVSLDRMGTGFLFVVDGNGKLNGVLTDGDIRRAFLRNASIDDLVEIAMQTNYTSLPIESDVPEINAVLDHTISFVPLVDQDNRLIDYASLARRRRYPVMEPLLDGNEANYVQECVHSGWVSSQGRFVGLFEKMMSDFHNVPYAVAVSNGTVALHLALISLGIGPGDEVIVPDLTFAATANAVLHAGATPVLVDVEPETWNMSAYTVERSLTERTRAILPVHLYGHPCEMGPLMALARRNDLLVIEDCAEALGARFEGKLVGSFGDAACYSFFGNKTLTTGEGGMVLFHDAGVYERARMLRDHGMSKQRRYWHLEVGYNYRLTNLQAAIGVAQMERIESILARKRTIATRYDETLSNTHGIILPPRASWADPVHWLYTLQISNDLSLSRTDLSDRLLLNGIETRPTFYPMHQMPPYQRFGDGKVYPVSDLLSESGLSLPSAITLRKDDIDTIVTTIKDIIDVREMAIAAGSLNSKV